MNLQHLTLQNVGRFAELDLQLPTGCTAVTGMNHAGKSTMLNAIELALFADGSRDLAPRLGPYSDRMVIQLEFDHAGRTYRIRRGYKQAASGAGTATLDFEELIETSTENGHGLTASTAHAGTWLPLTLDTAKNTQALVERTLGITRRTFRASSFLAQGDSAAFTEASPADRKQMIGDVLDPAGVWAALADGAKARAKTVEAELAADLARAQALAETVNQGGDITTDLALAQDEKTILDETVAQAETALELAQAAEAANAQAAERVRAVAAERDRASDQVAVAREKAANAQREAALLPAAREKLATLEAQAALVPELEALTVAQAEAQAAADAARREKANAEAAVASQKIHIGEIELALTDTRGRFDAAGAQLAHLEAAEDDTERCPMCAQILGADARAAAIEATRKALADLNDQVLAKITAIDEAGGVLTGLEKATEVDIPAVPEGDYAPQLVEARAAVARVAAGKVTIATYEQHAGQIDALHAALRVAAAELAEHEDRLAQTAAGVADTTALAAKTAEARTLLTTRRAALAQAAAAVARLEERQETLIRAQAELAEIQARTASAHTRLDLLRLAEKAYGRDGVPVLLAEAAIPHIEAEANRILEAMPMGDGDLLRVELHTQKALKSSDRVAETLDIVAYEGGRTGAYETFSGGERLRLNLALRIALARLLAARRGSEVRLLAIDEVDALDAVGLAGLVQVLKELDDVDRVLIVSHHPDLQLAFAERIEVIREDGVSRLAGASVEREPVAA